MMRAWPWGTPLQKCEISQAQALRVGYLKSMSSAIFTCNIVTNTDATRQGRLSRPHQSNMGHMLSD
jgi:hypothetical protein